MCNNHAQALRALEVVSKEVDSRSIIARPFPMDTNIDKLSAFFGEHGAVRGGGCLGLGKMLGKM